MSRRFKKRLAPALVATGLVLGAGLAFARLSTGAPAPQPRFELLAHVNPGGGISADVFGHRGYAYLSSWHGAGCPARGVRVYDLRNRRAPRLVSTFADRDSDPAVKGSWTEKTVVKPARTRWFDGQLAVTSFQACRTNGFQGFGLYDVSDPERPRKLALKRTSPRGSHEIWLEAAGKRAYVYTAIPASEIRSSPDFKQRGYRARIPGKPDFRIFDVSRPQRPTEIGSWGAWSELGIHPKGKGGAEKLNFTHSVIVNERATRAYLSYSDLGTVILDITRPSRPRYLGRTRFLPGERGDAHSAAVTRDGRLLIETHELPGGYPTFFDISNPRRPRRLAAFKLPHRTRGSVHDPKTRGKLAYFSWFRGGVVLVDISRPSKPRFLAQYVPRPFVDRSRSVCKTRAPCTRVWGVFPERNYVLASDMVSGLWVLRLK